MEAFSITGGGDLVMLAPGGGPRTTRICEDVIQKLISPPGVRAHPYRRLGGAARERVPHALLPTWWSPSAGRHAS
ncbi:hypothetical protein GCM10017687_79650 [Streptomyces echinatus]